MERKLFLFMVALVSVCLVIGGCDKSETEKNASDEGETTAQTDSTSVDDVADKLKETVKEKVALPENVEEIVEETVDVDEVIPAVTLPAVETPADETPADETPAEEAPEDETPADAPASGKTVKTSWADAKVGTMAKMKNMTGMFTVMEVVKADADNVTVKITMLGVDGNPMAGMEPIEQVQPREYAPDSKEAQEQEKFKNKKVGEKDITVAGKNLKCTIYETIIDMGGKPVTTHTYMCEDVPGSLVLMENDAMGKMQVMSELIDFKK